MNERLLLVEDDASIREVIEIGLERAGFRVTAIGDGADGLAEFRRRPYDAVLLDLMLPDTNGFKVCEDLRRWDAFVPIIMLTARGQEIDKIRGLDAGADDYVTKPFSVGELIARLRALFRRAARPAEAPVEVFTIGNVQVNMTAHTVSRGSRSDQLSFYEVELLRLLHERLGQPVSREEILQKIWGIEAGPSNRTVDNFIVKLRKKIERSPDKPEHILTVYGFGYKLAP